MPKKGEEKTARGNESIGNTEVLTIIKFEIGLVRHLKL